ncbi:hypothetical protein OAT67_07190 [Bacteriovoracaceae bacterium]|nr:hypothetical protein [Bacteriovoracaceae bacterium]
MNLRGESCGELEAYCMKILEKEGGKYRLPKLNCLLNVIENFIVSNFSTLIVQLGKSKKIFGLPDRYNARNIKVSSLREVVYLLKRQKLITLSLGYRSNNLKKLTTIKPTASLINILKSFQRITMLSYSHNYGEIIILKDENKNYIDFQDNKVTNRYRRDLNLINAHLEKSSITIYEEPLNCIYYRVFNNSSFKQGGRIYAHFLNMKKEKRSQIKINNTESVELDYSGLHINMLYILKTGNCFQGDVYKIKGYEVYRSLFKVALQICINTKSRRSAILALDKHLNEKKISIGIKVEVIIDKFIEKHALIRDNFFQLNGLELQFRDSQMALYTMTQGVKEGIVVLSVHDSFIVEKQFENWLRVTMNKASLKYLGSKIPIK